MGAESRRVGVSVKTLTGGIKIPTCALIRLLLLRQVADPKVPHGGDIRSVALEVYAVRHGAGIQGAV